MKRLAILLFIVTGIAALSAAQSPGTEPFRQEGFASWYGVEFDGKPTASGEIFDSALYTAAHPTLPFGTILTVTNTQNNLQVTVRVNDRGPFVAARIIDLSMAAAEALDMLTTRIAPVTVEQVVPIALGRPGNVNNAVPAFQAAPTTPVPQVVPRPYTPRPYVPQPYTLQPYVTQPYTPQPYTPQPYVPAVIAPVAPVAQTLFPVPPAYIRGTVPSPYSPNLYRLQVGSYRVPRNAVESFDRLRNLGLNPAYERHGDFYRVVLAGLRAADIPLVAHVLGNAGFREVLIRQETGY
ncbi:MAG: septal ring lytic transglycosylase RlpA family protein [Treponema sp.]|nr:septal ring lytic transglycosylase RlpA family protein [Treponema sp.]